eukprot:7206244-Prymnesium_polylepis.1
MLYYQEMPPRVRAAVGDAALARAPRPLCGHADQHNQLDLGKAGSAECGGQTRWHYAGWWVGAGRTVGDRHPRLWCAWGGYALSCFCPIVRAA